MSRRSAAFSLAAAITLIAGGCSHQQSGFVSWDEATPTERTAMGGGAPVRVAQPITTSMDLSAQERAGLQIDRALTFFTAERAKSRRMPKSSPLHGAAWLDVLARIDDAVQVAPTAEDLGAFVRARVMLEVEFHGDKDRGRLLPPDLKKRIQRSLASVDQRVSELRMSGAAGTMQPAPRLFEGDLILDAPVMPMVVTSVYGVRHDPIHGGRRFHAGIDVGAPHGTPVYTSAPGLVIFAGWQGGYGRHVVVDHGDGVRTHYSHLSQLWVKSGEILKDREPVGAIGDSGRATGPHLHFAVTDGEGKFRDPMKVLYTVFPVHVIDDDAVARLEKKAEGQTLARSR
jgi:murein DD-endopeptidase MepM/ murein hydrolase activator NlpD